MRMPGQIRGFVALVALLSACSETYVPTPLAVPDSAIALQQFEFLQGHAYQTEYTLKAAYPATPAFEHYLRIVPAPWIRCDWSGPNWQRFLDSTEGPTRTVLQQLHMWVNREAERTLMLATRYVSAGDCTSIPLDEDQHVVVVEYFGVDVDDTITHLKLTCPSKSPRPQTVPDAEPQKMLCNPEQPSLPTSLREP